MKPEETIKILDDMKIKIPIPKSAKTQLKKNEALDLAIKALKSQSRYKGVILNDAYTHSEEFLRAYDEGHLGCQFCEYENRDQLERPCSSCCRSYKDNFKAKKEGD